jgi:hypothetical protein
MVSPASGRHHQLHYLQRQVQHPALVYATICHACDCMRTFRTSLTLGAVWQSSLRCKGCASSCRILTSTEGTFSDGSGLEVYQESAICEWIIAPTGESRITIRFTTFQTESCCDFVKVYTCNDRTCGSKILLQQLSGSFTTPPSVTANSPYVLVEFISDGSVNFDGFSASWNVRCLIIV